MKNFKDFYSKPSIKALKKLIEEKRLTDATLYEFLDGYEEHRKYEISLDDF